MTDKEKIIEYLNNKGISKNKFYKETGFSIGFLDSGNSLGVDKLRIIIDKYPDFDPMWLLDEKGSMECNKQETKFKNSNKNLSQNISGKVEGNLTVTNNDLSKLIELQRGSQQIQRELNKRLETSQMQINTLLEILKSE